MKILNAIRPQTASYINNRNGGHNTGDKDRHWDTGKDSVYGKLSQLHIPNPTLIQKEPDHKT